MSHSRTCESETTDGPESNWAVNVEVDLQTTLALARASTEALLHLSPLAHREITDALTTQVEALERRGDPLSLAAANALRPYLDIAA